MAALMLSFICCVCLHVLISFTYVLVLLQTKQLQEACAQRVNLETALADLKASAEHQLHGLASQSEAAIDVAKEKLLESQTRLTQFYSVLKVWFKTIACNY